MGKVIGRRPSPLRAVSILLFGVYVMYSSVALLKGGFEPDEGFYLFAAKLVSEGERPYADFGLTQPPAHAWLGSVVLPYLGWTVYGTRMLGLILSCCTVIVGSIFLLRKKGWFSVVVFLLLFLSSPGWMERATIGKPFALGGFVILISGAIVLSDIPIVWRWWLYTAFSAIGCLVRLPLAPMFIIGSVGLLYSLPNNKTRIAFFFGSVLVSFLVLVSIGWKCWDSMLFWLVDYHRLRIMPPGGIFPLSYIIKDGLSHSTMSWLLLLFAMWYQRKNVLFLGLCVGVLMSLIFNLGSYRGYGVYVVFFIPLSILLVSWGLGPVIDNIRHSFKPYLIYVAMGSVVFGGWMFRNAPYGWEHSDYLEEYDSVVRFVRRTVRPASQIVATTIEVPVSAGFNVPNKLAMGMFGFTTSLSQERADQVHFSTVSDIIGFLEDPSTDAWVGSTMFKLNYSWSSPDQLRIFDEDRSAIIKCLEDNYRVSYMNKYYVVMLRKRETTL